ncbi:carbohydrate ABC transporter permease [Lacrimispora celerecrescens]|uniref:Sugar ABC transporter permease n=1 Tax=Lacrimispora celerecrescens TaxID=29354 RepID=A0A084JQ35_9FIRM|nr:carbohydrate ABC transporter permease [Lacrimispora celerecrescens]KEZ91069.1 sugar ABC transporter permease [Lacrimispora celerecrescens]
MKNGNKKHISKAAWLPLVGKWVFLGIMIIFTLYPVIYTVLGSLKTNAELTQGGGFFPETWHFENYYRAFVQADFTRYTLNSIVVSVSVTLLAVVTCSLSGFILARREFAGKKVLLALYLSMMFVSLGSVTLYPIYELLRALKLNKSIFALIVALTGGQATNVFLVMGFTKGIPKELDEAAIIDGCSLYGVYSRVVLPLSKPILAVVALFSFRNAWNDYITSMIMTISMPKLQTLTVAVVQLKYSVNAAAEWHIMLAGASIAIIPILIVYLFANKQFIAGLTAGAVKG